MGTAMEMEAPWPHLIIIRIILTTIILMRLVEAVDIQLLSVLVIGIVPTAASRTLLQELSA